MQPKDYLLTNQVAIVTGGGGGIGRAIALTLAEAGADIVVVDIVPERCAEVAERVSALGRTALPVPMDVTDTERVRAMVDQAEKHFGRIDILVNNAGGVSGRPFLEQSERSWKRHIDLNLVSMLAATSAAVPAMIRGGRGGGIVNVTSIEASRAAPNYAVYAACKAGMCNFTRTTALEFSAHGIRVNAIAPDYTVTPGVSGNVTGPVDRSKWMEPSPEQKDATARRIPLGRGGIDDECGKAALFLLSPMSSYVTGVVLPVDGGTWASSGWSRTRSGAWTLNGDPG
ncbi:MAG: SDR family oxidoreductase [Rhodospirillaceae bacterium]|nr:MAG: SDR family oxidoreductase [Rhodospirillaceae bacterium]